MKNNHFDSKRDCNMPITQRDHNACFTLIELLIVIANHLYSCRDVVASLEPCKTESA